MASTKTQQQLTCASRSPSSARNSVSSMRCPSTAAVSLATRWRSVAAAARRSAGRWLVRVACDGEEGAGVGWCDYVQHSIIRMKQIAMLETLPHCTTASQRRKQRRN